MEFPIEIGLNPFHTEAGFFVMASVVDITERKRTEEKARRNDEKFRVAIESAPNGIVMVNQRGEIILCNSEAEKMFGYGSGELMGQSVEVLVPQEIRSDHPGLRTQFHEHPSKRQMGAGRDLRGVRKDGVEIPVEIGLSPIETTEGTFVLAAILDISERKRGEEKLAEAYQEVQRRNQEMEQFVYTVSHDLRSPLVTTMAFIGFLREDMADKKYEEVNDSLVRIEKANQRMQQLIDDLLQLSRAGRLELKLEDTDVNDVLADVGVYIAQMAEEKGIGIEIAEDFPRVLADRNRLHQALENLLINAIRHGSDLPNPHIRVFWKDAGDEIQLCVADNGQGIAPEYHHKIFLLFQRLETAHEGTGVGLAIVARVAELHGGRAWVESEPGKGAAFWISFPKAEKKL
jgi:PAS domain S-box-containing protein